MKLPYPSLFCNQNYYLALRCSFNIDAKIIFRSGCKLEYAITMDTLPWEGKQPYPECNYISEQQKTQLKYAAAAYRFNMKALYVFAPVLESLIMECLSVHGLLAVFHGGGEHFCVPDYYQGSE